MWVQAIKLHECWWEFGGDSLYPQLFFLFLFFVLFCWFSVFSLPPDDISLLGILLHWGGFWFDLPQWLGGHPAISLIPDMYEWLASKYPSSQVLRLEDAPNSPRKWKPQSLPVFRNHALLTFWASSGFPLFPNHSLLKCIFNFKSHC